MITALALILSLSGPPAMPAPDCPHLRTAEPGAPALAGGRCRVVLIEPGGHVPASGPVAHPAPHPRPRPDPAPCRVEIVPHIDPVDTDCPRVRVRETRREHASRRTVRAGDVITLDAIGVATLDGGVGGSAGPVFISHGGGTVIVNTSASAFASASASASAHASARFRGGYRGHGGGRHGGH